MSTQHPRAHRDNSQSGVRPARSGRAFTWKDAKEAAWVVLALWVAGLVLGAIYFGQLAGLLG